MPEAELRKLLTGLVASFGVVGLHLVLGGLGRTRPYAVNKSDVRASLQVYRHCLTQLSHYPLFHSLFRQTNSLSL